MHPIGISTIISTLLSVAVVVAPHSALAALTQQTPYVVANPETFILQAAKPSSGKILVLANDVSNRNIQINRIVEQSTLGSCTIEPNVAGTARQAIVYTRPAGPSLFTGVVGCRYEACTIPRVGETRVCAQAGLTIEVQRPTSNVNAIADFYDVDRA